MRIALSGTPGTGKTAVARELRRLGEEVVELNRLAREHGFLGRLDRRRRTREVDLAGLDGFLAGRFPDRERLFIEGHLSHLVSVDRAVVLRCRPAILRRRLRRRGYPESKVRENSLAEALDAITTEAAGILGPGRVIELDTTGQKPRAMALRIIRLAGRDFCWTRSLRPGSIDWSGDVLRNPNYYI